MDGVKIFGRELPEQRGPLQEPAADRVLGLIDKGDPVFGPVLMEIHKLKRLEIEVTPELVERIIRRVRERLKPHPVSTARPDSEARPRPGARRGRFADITNDGPVVYYMRIGDRVKIGTTTNLYKRLQAINPEELLVVEAGDATVERRRHKEFSDLHTHGEWFRYEGALAEHIATLRAATGEPDPDTTGYITLEDIVDVYCVSRVYAYRLASAEQWRRYRHPDGRVRYRLADVDNTLAARASLRKDRRESKVRD